MYGADALRTTSSQFAFSPTITNTVLTRARHDGPQLGGAQVLPVQASQQL
jgi:hypothetical protein